MDKKNEIIIRDLIHKIVDFMSEYREDFDPNEHIVENYELYQNVYKAIDQYAHTVRGEMFTKEELEVILFAVSGQCMNYDDVYDQLSKKYANEYGDDDTEKIIPIAESAMEKLTELTNILEEK